jgi:hypothetical protein
MTLSCVSKIKGEKLGWCIKNAGFVIFNKSFLQRKLFLWTSFQDPPLFPGLITDLIQVVYLSILCNHDHDPVGQTV